MVVLIRLRNRLCAVGALVLPALTLAIRYARGFFCDGPDASRDMRSCRRLPQPWIVKPLAKLHRSDSADVVTGRVNENDGILRCNRRRYL